MGVRTQLLAGDKTLQIKACSLSNGFWHLGEFAALYAAPVGEAPSSYSARSHLRPFMKNGATEPYSSLGLGPKPWLPSYTVKITEIEVAFMAPRVIVNQI